MSGKFVISLDFELMWGVRDKRTIENYGESILGARTAVLEMLNLFKIHDIHVTWAIVGLLFAENKEEMLEFYPNILPSYINTNFCPYSYLLNEVGNNEKDDPYHYAFSLIKKIASSPNQEIATHTYSHYYCLENGQNVEQFKVDLLSAINIARSKGIKIKSIVFPRNQFSDEYVSASNKLGLSYFRGNPESFIYQESSQESINNFVRGLRLIDSIIPIDGHHCFGKAAISENILNIKSSRFLRPITSKTPSLFSKLQYYRIVSEMKYAAKNNLIYHLWWHPHNFGLNTAENIYNLNKILLFFKKLEKNYGMQSLSMSQL